MHVKKKKSKQYRKLNFFFDIERKYKGRKPTKQENRKKLDKIAMGRSALVSENMSLLHLAPINFRDETPRKKNLC